MSDETEHGTDAELRMVLPPLQAVLDLQRSDLIARLLQTMWGGAWYPADTLVGRVGPLIPANKAWRKAVGQRERMKHRRGGTPDLDLNPTADDDAAIRTGRRMIVSHDLEGMRRRGLVQWREQVDDVGQTRRSYRLAPGAKTMLMARAVLSAEYREGRTAIEVIEALQQLLDRPEETL